MATNKIRTNIYIDKDIKEQAQKLFSTFNISLSDAINLFLTQSVLNKGIPFKIEIPNEETQQAIQEARIGKNMEKVTFEELKKEMTQCLK
jgi:DNA-damage-inducible protein J